MTASWKDNETEALRAELGLSPVQAASRSLVSVPETTLLSVDLAGMDLTVNVPAASKPAFRRRFKEWARREKRRAADAGNAANTSQLCGGSIGGALATSGVVALATAAGPMPLAAILATGAGALIAAAGLIAGHWMSQRRFEHEERMERYLDLAEEMK